MLEKELQVALSAVQRAAFCAMNARQGIKSIQKCDSTPVTGICMFVILAADVACQLLIVSALLSNFPDDAIIAEEDAESLTMETKSHVLELLREAGESPNYLNYLNQDSNRM